MTVDVTHTDRNRPQLRQYTTVENAVLNATVSLAINIGFTNVTIDATSATSGISKAVILYHFCTKKELILTLLVSTSQKAISGHAQDTCHKCSVLLLLAAAQYPDVFDLVRSGLPNSVKCYPNIAGMLIESVSKNVFG